MHDAGRDVVFFDLGDDFVGLTQRGGQRFFAEKGCAGAGGSKADRGVVAMGYCDVHGVHEARTQQVSIVGKPGGRRNLKAVADEVEALGRGVGHGGDLPDSRHALQHGRVALFHDAAAADKA